MLKIYWVGISYTLPVYWLLIPLHSAALQDFRSSARQCVSAPENKNFEWSFTLCELFPLGKATWVIKLM